MSPTTTDSRPIIYTQFADKRWGHGQLARLVRRWWHRRTSHNWGPWNVEPPEDELGRWLSPEPHTPVFCFRACHSSCGAVQHTTVRFDQHRSLPDD